MKDLSQLVLLMNEWAETHGPAPAHKIMEWSAEIAAASNPAKVVNFQRYNLDNTAEALRLLAHQIDAGELGNDVIALIILQLSEGVTYRAFGPEFSTTTAAGMCALAQAAIIKSAT